MEHARYAVPPRMAISGARWWKFDFHTHTPASIDTTAWQKAKGTADEVTPEKWLLSFMKAGIDCVAVTDHNSGAWIDLLKVAYQDMVGSRPPGFREIHLFPGVEISVHGGLHLLAIFGQDKSAADIDKLLGSVGYGGSQGDSDAVTRRSLTEVVSAVLDAGGVPIPAHVDRPKGLLQLDESDPSKCKHDPTTIQQVLDNGEMLAIEVVDTSRPKPAIYTQNALKWAEIVGSDCHSFRDHTAPGNRFTWVKMSEPTIDGLRLALMDGEGFSIRRSDSEQPFDPLTLPEHFIEQIEVDSARYMGRGTPQLLKLNPWFNAVVGGRGTGKSTIIHCLRLAFLRNDELDVLNEHSEVSRTFQSFSRIANSREDSGGLRDETAIQVTLMRDGVLHKLTWSKKGSDTKVEAMVSEEWETTQSQEITSERFPLRIFSQGQIAALASERSESLLGLVDGSADIGSEYSQFEERRKRYMTMQSQIRELALKIADRPNLVVRLEDTDRKLRRFEEQHHAEVLRDYQKRVKQSAELERLFEAAGESAQNVRELSGKLSVPAYDDDLFDAEDDIDRTALDLLDHISTSVQALQNALGVAVAEIESGLETERKRLKQTVWSKTHDLVKERYRSLVESLQEQGINDPNEYDQLVQEKQLLESEIGKLDNLIEKRKELEQEAGEQLELLLRARQAITRKRQDFLTEVLVDNPYVRITVVAYGRNERVAERHLREELDILDQRFGDDILKMENGVPSGGIIAELFTVSSEDEDPTRKIEDNLTRFRERFRRACQGNGDYSGRFNNHLRSKPSEFLDRMMTWYPQDGLKVEYSPKGDGRDFRPIAQASAGQRAAAMLAFLLAYGDEPIVLDQPEDDLDNYLIYDLVVQQIRDNKLRRQIIVVTHNPNIVVNGDAEMVHAMDFRGGQCRVVQSGSLQERAMRDEVCRIMEGGREAFERRYRRLG